VTSCPPGRNYKAASFFAALFLASFDRKAASFFAALFLASFDRAAASFFRGLVFGAGGAAKPPCAAASP
jgi:hypothetical protein